MWEEIPFLRRKPVLIIFQEGNVERMKLIIILVLIGIVISAARAWASMDQHE